MAPSNDHDIKILNCLIETTIDSADGYAEAAKNSENTRYRAVFSQRASERRFVASNLQQQVRILGGEPEDEGTVLAKAHRVCINLRAAVGSGGDAAIVDEVERCEDHIKAKYEDAIKDTELGVATRAVINEAFISVQSGHDQMREIKHALHAAT